MPSWDNAVTFHNPKAEKLSRKKEWWHYITLSDCIAICLLPQSKQQCVHSPVKLKILKLSPAWLEVQQSNKNGKLWTLIIHRRMKQQGSPPPLPGLYHYKQQVKGNQKTTRHMSECPKGKCTVCTKKLLQVKAFTLHSFLAWPFLSKWRICICGWLGGGSFFTCSQKWSGLDDLPLHSLENKN